MNSLLTIEVITVEALRVLTNMLVFTGLVNRQFDPMFGQPGAKAGDVVYARVPPRYTVRRGNKAAPQASVETRVPVRVGEPLGVDLQFSDVERKLSLENYSDNFLKPVLAQIANTIDNDGLKLYKKVYNVVGTPGTIPASTNANPIYLGAGVKLDHMGAPQDDQRHLVVTPDMQAAAVAANFSLFNPQGVISEGFRRGRFGRQVLGFDWYMDQNTATHTDGTRTGTNGTTWSVSGANQTGTSLLITGLTSGDTLKEGDTFTIGTIAAGNGVQSVNPMSREATGALQCFRVTADFTSDGGTDTINIEPAITPSGAFQTVDRSPASGAVLTFHAESAAVSKQGLAFHRDAFTYVSVPLELPKGVHEAYTASDDQTGLGVRIVTAYDIHENMMLTRFDVLGGWACLRPELACRIAS